MKKFCVNVLVTLVMASIVLLALTWYHLGSVKRADWRLKSDTHIIAIGPSTTACALNEKHIKGFQNLSRNGTPLSCLIPLLPRILEDNPHIDTVLINHGRFVFKHMTNEKATERMQEIKDKLPFLFYNAEEQDWSSLLSNVNFYCAILNPDFMQMVAIDSRTLQDFGFGHSDIERHNLENEEDAWSIAWYDSVMVEHGGNVYTRDWIMKHCQSSDYWARRAIEICKCHDVVPVLFFTPLYEYDRWCTWDGFCEYIQDYDDNTLIADYEDFKFPDNSYYGDVHHLNRDGADYLTTFIADHGLQAQTLEQWLAEKCHVLESCKSISITSVEEDE